MNLYEVYPKTGGRKLIMARSGSDIEEVIDSVNIQLVASEEELSKVVVLREGVEQPCCLETYLRDKRIAYNLHKAVESFGIAAGKAARNMQEVGNIFHNIQAIPPDLTYGWTTAEQLGCSEGYLTWLADCDRIDTKLTDQGRIYKRRINHGVD